MSREYLDIARRSQQDEFYTLYDDIEEMVNRYKDIFKGKTVYSNCDTEDSNFVKFFTDKFDELELKDYIATGYSSTGQGSLIEYGQEPSNLMDNGSFDSFLLLPYIRRADIVVTNPPFSLIRQYLKYLNRNKKNFILVAPHHIIGYAELKQKILKGHIKILHSPNKFIFEVPYNYNNYEKSKRMFVEDDRKYIIMGNIIWITNMDLESNIQPIVPTASYDEKSYEKYENKDAININSITDIPKDYYGLMGVPISYLRRHNKDLFEIVDFRKGDDGRDLRTPTNYSLYTRVLIKRRTK